MSKKLHFLSLVFLIGGVFLSACSGLIKQVENAVQEDYGPASTPAERQTHAFEALWKDVEANFIYYDSAGVDWNSIHDNYLAQIQAGLTDDQFDALMKKLEADLPNGALFYLSRSERIKNDSSDVSAYEGIGAIIGFYPEAVPHVVILDVMVGSPAEKAGIKPHDSIYAINGNPVLLEEGLDVVNRIRGPAGSQVTFQVKTPGKDEHAIEVTRGKLTSSGKLTSFMVKGKNYGYILFPPINYGTMAQDVLNTLQGFSGTKKLDGLILDLRVANSSVGFPLENLLTLFSNGKIGEFFYRTQDSQPVSVDGLDRFDSQSVPLVILIGKNTSGLAEIMAATLQANKRATLIGETTSGDVETPTAFFIPNGARIIIDTGSFRLPNGDEIKNDGIQPNVTVDAGWDEVAPNADPVLDQAIQSLDKQQ